MHLHVQETEVSLSDGSIRGLDTAPEYMTSTTDLDNLVKFYLDALSGKAFGDDRQIVRGNKTVRYGGPSTHCNRSGNVGIRGAVSTA